MRCQGSRAPWVRSTPTAAPLHVQVCPQVILAVNWRTRCGAGAPLRSSIKAFGRAPNQALHELLFAFRSTPAGHLVRGGHKARQFPRRGCMLERFQGHGHPQQGSRTIVTGCGHIRCTPRAQGEKQGACRGGHPYFSRLEPNALLLFDQLVHEAVATFRASEAYTGSECLDDLQLYPSQLALLLVVVSVAAASTFSWPASLSLPNYQCSAASWRATLATRRSRTMMTRPVAAAVSLDARQIWARRDRNCSCLRPPREGRAWSALGAHAHATVADVEAKCVRVAAQNRCQGVGRLNEVDDLHVHSAARMWTSHKVGPL